MKTATKSMRASSSAIKQTTKAVPTRTTPVKTATSVPKVTGVRTATKVISGVKPVITPPTRPTTTPRQATNINPNNAVSRPNVANNANNAVSRPKIDKPGTVKKAY